MHTMRNVLFLMVLILIPLVPVNAQTQELPSADWYAVVWSRGEDTLHWVSPNGEPASITRPQLPSEAVNANPQMRFSRDGRYMLLVAELNNGLNGIGIYDIQAGQFTQTHQAQTDEIIYLGRDYTSNLSATQMAVGFASSDFEDNTWRIIVFDLASGATVNVLSRESSSWEMDIPPSIPVITYFDVDESIGQEVIHFEMIPKLQTPTEIVPAFKWYPALSAPADMGLSAYTFLDADINYLTGEIVRAYADANFPSLPAPESGLNYNAIGRAVPTLEDIPPTSIWVDTQRYLYNPIWANSTEWVTFFSESTEEGIIAGWQVVPRDGLLNEKVLTPLPANVREVFGTPDGLLTIDIENRVSHITDLSLVEGTLLFQATDSQLAQIVFVVKDAGSFLLDSVGEPSSLSPVLPTPVLQATVSADAMIDSEVFCEGTLPSILSIGSTAQVSNTDGIPLRMREVPGGAVVTEITEGTAFTVLDGPQCFNGFTWWQIQIESGDAGWSAEGDSEDYWVSVLQPAPEPTVLVPTEIPTESTDITVVATATPLSGSDTTTDETVAEAPATEEIPQTGDGNCGASPESRVIVGINVIVQAAGGSLAFRANPLDSAPVAQLPDQTILPIVGGPACRTGYRQWQVRATIDGVLRDGWVSEGTVTRYFLEPSE